MRKALQRDPKPQHCYPSCMADGVVCSARAVGCVIACRQCPSILLSHQGRVTIESFRPKFAKPLFQIQHPQCELNPHCLTQTRLGDGTFFALTHLGDKLGITEGPPAHTSGSLLSDPAGAFSACALVLSSPAPASLPADHGGQWGWGIRSQGLRIPVLPTGSQCRHISAHIDKPEASWWGSHQSSTLACVVKH